MKNIFCHECGKQLKNYRSKLCRECSNIKKFSKVRVSKECPTCNIIFTFAKWQNKKYCSLKCSGKSKMNIPIKYCELCGNQIKMSPTGNITYFRKKRFCSPHCRGIYNAAPRKKRNVEDNQWQRWLFKRDIQIKVFQRDNYTCQLCSSKKDLQVDHIQSWADYVELRFSIDNCRTLCAKCHYKITFGKPMPEHIKTWGRNFRKAVVSNN